MHRKAVGQHGDEEFFGGRLSCAASHANEAATPLSPDRLCQLLQCRDCIRNRDERPPDSGRRTVEKTPFHYRGHSTKIESLGDEIVSIKARPPYRKEQRAGCDGARINRVTLNRVLSPGGRGVKDRGNLAGRLSHLAPKLNLTGC